MANLEKCVWKELVEKRGTTGKALIERSRKGENISCIACDGSKAYADEINCKTYVVR